MARFALTFEINWHSYLELKNIKSHDNDWRLTKSNLLMHIKFCYPHKKNTTFIIAKNEYKYSLKLSS